MIPTIPAQAWGKPVLVAVMVLPLLVIVLLFAPAWLAAVFLPQPQRTAVLGLVGQLRGWHREILELLAPTPPDACEGNTPGDPRSCRGA